MVKVVQDAKSQLATFLKLKAVRYSIFYSFVMFVILLHACILLGEFQMDLLSVINQIECKITLSSQGRSA